MHNFNAGTSGIKTYKEAIKRQAEKIHYLFWAEHEAKKSYKYTNDIKIVDKDKSKNNNC